MKEAAIKSIMLKNLKSYQIFTKLRGDLGLGKESLHWKFQSNHFTYVGESVGELVCRGVQLRFWQMKSNFLRDLNLYTWKRIDTQKKKHVVLIFLSSDILMHRNKGKIRRIPWVLLLISAITWYLMFFSWIITGSWFLVNISCFPHLISSIAVLFYLKTIYICSF